MANTRQDLNISHLRISTDQGGDFPSPSIIATSRAPVLSRPNILVRDFLRKYEKMFRDLDELRDKIWKHREADEHYKKLQKYADNPSTLVEEMFYKMNKSLGIQLHEATQAFYVKKKFGSGYEASSLNLCMAPGGYTWQFLQRNPNATACGLTLPPEKGGHPMYLPYGDKDPRVAVEYLDITLLTEEFGIPREAVPKQHPEAESFSLYRPFLGKSFDVVICDGQVLRIHQHQRDRAREVPRLLVSQLILGMQRIKPGGTFVILLHKVDAWGNIILLKTFETFSKIKLHKAETSHATRSSFYLVARDVQPDKPEAVDAVKKWKADWWKTTFEGEHGTGVNLEEPNDQEVYDVLKIYGSRLVELGKPIWSTQWKALKKAPFGR